MIYIYPAIFHANSDGSYTVIFPDLPGCITEGKDLPNAMLMSRDALAIWIDSMLNDNLEFAMPSKLSMIIANDDDEFVTLVDSDIEKYRRLWDNQAIKRTLSLPTWLDSMASDAKLSLSKVLQEALYEKLDVNPR